MQKVHFGYKDNELTKYFVFQKGQGAPGREPVFSEEEKKHMMAYAYRKQDELKVSITTTNEVLYMFQ